MPQEGHAKHATALAAGIFRQLSDQDFIHRMRSFSYLNKSTIYDFNICL